ncbi:unnamed protein product, partial [Symbiodinium sp. CCMP2456]
VRKPALDAVQPDILLPPVLDAKEPADALSGPLFEQCRVRKVTGDLGGQNSSEKAPSKANVSLIASDDASSSCSESQISLVTFQSNGQ